MEPQHVMAKFLPQSWFRPIAQTYWVCHRFALPRRPYCSTRLRDADRLASGIGGAFVGTAAAICIRASRRMRRSVKRAPRRQAFELWLDCRGSDYSTVDPQTLPHCDRLLHSTHKPSVADKDLVWESMDHRFGWLLDSSRNVVGAGYVGGGVDAQARALAAVGSAEWVMLEATDGVVYVPAENLIAAGRQAGTRVAVVASSVQDVAGLVGALQLGVDAVVLPRPDSEQAKDMWKEATKPKLERSTAALDDRSDASREHSCHLTAATVTSVSRVGGLGDRVCLDLIQLMEKGEGALIGSTAKALCFVQAETAKTGLVPPRPFRVNAGPVHAYVALKDGRTKYLSEVEAGDEILIVKASAKGATVDSPISSRSITVGRCKIEPRPMLCARFCAEERIGQIFLQQAETVRVLARDSCTSDWQPCSITELREGMQILVRWADMGTHVGRRISASVWEK